MQTSIRTGKYRRKSGKQWSPEKFYILDNTIYDKEDFKINKETVDTL